MDFFEEHTKPVAENFSGMSLVGAVSSKEPLIVLNGENHLPLLTL